MTSLPVLIDEYDSSEFACTALMPVSMESPHYNEAWVQKLIHRQPRLICANDIEACFDVLVPIVMEFALPSGFLDNVYVTPEGYLVLVEVKLWKNAESRRKVVAQIVEYAKDFSALKYEDINHEIRRQMKGQSWGENPLYEMVVCHVPDAPDEVQFVERVSRNLLEGRFLLVVLGDGIRSEMAALAEHLLHHQLRYAFGMVELKMYMFANTKCLVVPRLVARTQTIERHVTVVQVTSEKSVPVLQEKIEKRSFSLDGFYAWINQFDARSSSIIASLITALSDIPVEVQTGNKGESLMLKVPLAEGAWMTVLSINKVGVDFWAVPQCHVNDPAWQLLTTNYFENIIRLVPDATIKQFASGHRDVKLRDSKIPLFCFQNKTQELAQCIRTLYTSALRFHAD